MTVPLTWRGKCRQNGVAPLKLVPFLPQDNSSVGAASQATLVRANAELGRCLALPFPVFLSFVLEDTSLGKFVDTFLRWAHCLPGIYIARGLGREDVYICSRPIDARSVDCLCM